MGTCERVSGLGVFDVAREEVTEAVFAWNSQSRPAQRGLPLILPQRYQGLIKCVLIVRIFPFLPIFALDMARGQQLN